MRHPGHKYTIGWKVNRAQLDMGLEEEAIRIQGDFKHNCQFFGLRARYDRHGEHDQVGGEHELTVEDRLAGD